MMTINREQGTGSGEQEYECGCDFFGLERLEDLPRSQELDKQ